MRTLVWAVLVGALVVQHPVGSSPFCPMAQHQQIALALQQEGNPGHQAPPKGWACTPVGWIKDNTQTAEAPCHCHPVASKESSCEERQEEFTCLVYCYASSCACPPTDCR